MKILASVLLICFLGVSAHAMTAQAAMEEIMENHAGGVDAVNVAYGLRDILCEENTHVYNVAVYEAIRQVNGLGSFGLTWSQLNLHAIVQAARNIVAYEDTKQ